MGIPLVFCDTEKCCWAPKMPTPPQGSGLQAQDPYSDPQNCMNLPPDKVQLLSQYDDEKKWELICDQVRCPPACARPDQADASMLPFHVALGLAWLWSLWTWVSGAGWGQGTHSRCYPEPGGAGWEGSALGEEARKPVLFLRRRER